MSAELLKGKYEIGERIAEDVLSYFYLGKVCLSGRQVFIWEYKAEFLNPAIIKELIDLSESLSFIKHAHILSLIDYYSDGTSFYTIHETGFAETFQLGDLIPLEEYLKSEAAYTYSSLWKLASQILNVLLVLESKKIQCGCITVHNLFVDPAGTHIRLTRIGLPINILKHQWPHLSVVDDCIFYPPEFIQKQEFTGVSDIYAFGMLLYVFFSHQWPYKYTNKIDKFRKELLKEPTPFQKVTHNIPDKLGPLVHVCIEKSVKKRFSSFEQLVKSYQKGQGPTFFETTDEDETSIEEELKHAIRESRVRKVKKWISDWGKIGGVVAVIGMGYFLYSVSGTHSPDKMVPNLVGLPVKDAQLLLEKNHFKSEVGGYRMHPDMPKDYVIDSNPQSGKAVKQDRLVLLFVSKGPTQITVPDFVGKTLEEATQTLEEGVTFNVYEEIFSEKPKGMILSQTPSANTRIEPGKSVHLIVSKGK